LRNCGMIVGKNLSLELAQGLFHLCRIQLHDYSCFCLQPFGVRAILAMKYCGVPRAKFHGRSPSVLVIHDNPS
jgi:hypothetical protein